MTEYETKPQKINPGKKDQDPRGKSPLGWVMTVAAVSCVVGVTLPAIANLQFSKLSNESGITQKPDSRSQLQLPLKATTDVKYLEAFAWAARVKLEDLSLHRSIKITASEDGTLLATGKITSGFTKRYETFKKWYNSRNNFPQLLDEVETLDNLGALPGVKSVWFGEITTAFFDDGTQGSIGSTIGNSWEIVSIDTISITLKKDDAIVFVEY